VPKKQRCDSFKIFPMSVQTQGPRVQTGVTDSHFWHACPNTQQSYPNIPHTKINFKGKTK